MDIKKITLIILFSLLLKLLYLLFAIALNHNVQKNSLYHQYINLAIKNDAHWYEIIAENGYSKITNKRDLGYSKGANFKQSEWAFFPLYPLINRTTIKILNVPYDFSAFIWSLFFSTVACLGMYWFGMLYYKDKKLAFFNTLVLFSFPFSFYYSMFYTEAIFFTFMIYSFIAIYYKRYLLLSILIIPLSLIRPNGIVILIPLYLYFLERNGIFQKFTVNWRQIFTRKIFINSLAFISAPLSFLAYCFYQYKMTGYFFAFSIAQAGWYRELSFPWVSFFNSGKFPVQFNSIFTIIVIIYAVLIWKKLPLSLNILVLLGLLLPLCSGSVTSMTRFVSVIFPMFLVLSASIYKFKYKYLVLSLILILHFASFYTWLITNPLSF